MTLSKNSFRPLVEIGYHFPRELFSPQSTRTYLSLVQFGTRGNSTSHGTIISILTSGIRHLTNVLFGCLSENRKPDFVRTIRNALDLGVSREQARSFDPRRYLKILITKKDTSQMLPKTSCGKFEVLVWAYIAFDLTSCSGQADDVYFCRVESLRSDLMAFFEKNRSCE